jgi:hypothetical protein
MTDFDPENIPQAPAGDFDPSEFLITPREETKVVTKLATDQAAAANEVAYKAALKDKPPEPAKFTAALAKGLCIPVSDPIIVAQHESYVLLYPARLKQWREKHPQHAEREDAEIQAAKEKKQKAEAAARSKKRKFEPNTPLGELVKSAMLKLDDARAIFREIEKAAAAGGVVPAENVAPVENGKHEE